MWMFLSVCPTQQNGLTMWTGDYVSKDLLSDGHDANDEYDDDDEYDVDDDDNNNNKDEG